MGNPASYATHSDVKEISDGLHEMTMQLSNLVIEMRLSNKSSGELVKAIQAEQKSMREDISDLRERMPLVEDTRKDIKTISSRVIGAILVTALISAMAAGFVMKTAKASPPPAIIERSK